MLGVSCLLRAVHWYPIMLDLHRFMIAIARVSVNHDGRGGTAPDPLVWDQGSRPKVRRLAVRVNVDLASLLVLLVFFILLGYRFMLATFLVMIFRVGLIVCLFWLSLLPFLVDYTGLPVLLI